MKHLLKILPTGDIRCLYTEAIDLHKLGTLTMERASKIEFNAQSQQWEVLPDHATEIANHVAGPLFSSPSRQACLDWEREYFNAQLAK